MASITYLTAIDFEAGAIATLGSALADLGIKRPLLVADSWNSRREPLGSPTHHDLAGLQALTRTAQHARPDLMPLSTDPCEVARLIDAAVGAPVVLIADGPQRSNRVLVGEMGSNRRAG